MQFNDSPKLLKKTMMLNYPCVTTNLPDWLVILVLTHKKWLPLLWTPTERINMKFLVFPIAKWIVTVKYVWTKITMHSCYFINYVCFRKTSVLTISIGPQCHYLQRVLKTTKQWKLLVTVRALSRQYYNIQIIPWWRSSIKCTTTSQCYILSAQLTSICSVPETHLIMCQWARGHSVKDSSLTYPYPDLCTSCRLSRTVRRA